MNKDNLLEAVRLAFRAGYAAGLNGPCMAGSDSAETAWPKLWEGVRHDALRITGFES